MERPMPAQRHCDGRHQRTRRKLLERRKGRCVESWLQIGEFWRGIYMCQLGMCRACARVSFTDSFVPKESCRIVLKLPSSEGTRPIC